MFFFSNYHNVSFAFNTLLECLLTPLPDKRDNIFYDPFRRGKSVRKSYFHVILYAI